jgi:DNA uptake protein ComE-like DNA-binding protein
VKRILKDYFSFSRNERNGIIVLLSIILALLIALQIIPYIIKSKTTDFSAFKKDVAAFEASIDSIPNDKNFINTAKNKPALINVDLYIDPNTASDQELLKIGLKGYQVVTIRKYLSKGGKLSKPEDLKKIYGITNNQYNAISPHLRFGFKTAETAIRQEFHKLTTEKEKKVFVELNSADTLTMIRIPGIGKVFANRIIKYRNQLGGFHNKSQLLEIYGIDSNLYNKINPIVFIDTLKLKKINLNIANYEELKHPYLNSYMIKGIMKYRQFKGKITKTEELLKNNLLSPEIYNKIKPYLVTD